MYDCPSRTPRKARGRSRPMRGSATLTTVESRNTIPDPRTAAARIQRCLVTLPSFGRTAYRPTGRLSGALLRGSRRACERHVERVHDQDRKHGPRHEVPRPRAHVVQRGLGWWQISKEEVIAIGRKVNEPDRDRIDDGGREHPQDRAPGRTHT